MNQTFSLSRFGRLLRTYLSDNRGALFINLLLLIGILSVSSLFFYRSYPDVVDRNRQVVYFLIGWAAWFVFTGQQVIALNDKEQAITYLLRPASLFEKYLLIFVISGIGFLVVYLLLFTLVDVTGVSYVNHRNWTPDQLHRIQLMAGRLHIESFYASETISHVPMAVWAFSLLLHPITLVFALLIRRFTLPLVAVVIIALAVIGTVGNDYFVHGLFGKVEVQGLPFSDSSVIRNNNFRQIELPQPLGNQIRYAVAITVVVLLYITAYFRIKEREV